MRFALAERPVSWHLSCLINLRPHILRNPQILTSNEPAHQSVALFKFDFVIKHFSSVGREVDLLVAWRGL